MHKRSTISKQPQLIINGENETFKKDGYFGFTQFFQWEKSASKSKPKTKEMENSALKSEPKKPASKSEPKKPVLEPESEESVLNTLLLCSHELGQKFTAELGNIGYLEIPPPGPTSKIDPPEMNLLNFTSLTQLIIKLRNSDPIKIRVPKSVENFDLSIIEDPDPSSCADAVQVIDFSKCDSLKTMVTEGYRDVFPNLQFIFPLQECPNFTTFISNTRTAHYKWHFKYEYACKRRIIMHNPLHSDWFTNLEFVLCSPRDDLLPFLCHTHGGGLTMDHKMCPNIIKVALIAGKKLPSEEFITKIPETSLSDFFIKLFQIVSEK